METYHIYVGKGQTFRRFFEVSEGLAVLLLLNRKNINDNLSYIILDEKEENTSLGAFYATDNPPISGLSEVRERLGGLRLVKV